MKPKIQKIKIILTLCAFILFVGNGLQPFLTSAHAVEIPYTQVTTDYGNMAIYMIQWPAMANGDTGTPYIMPHAPERSVQIKGTFGAAGNCRIEGSNDKTSPTWAALNDPFGTALNVTAAKLVQILENSYQIRPYITAGDGTTAITVTILFKGTK